MNIWLPATEHLAERIYVNRIQNKNLQNLYASHIDLCSRDPSPGFQDETTQSQSHIATDGQSVSQ
jgi:hypothetical protein